MYFPTKYLRTYPQNHSKTLFWGTFQCETYYTEIYCNRFRIERSLKMGRALRQSHVNGATTLKLYGYIGIGK